MCIIHITYAFGLGGIETMLRNIVNEQIKFGHEIHLIVINDFVNISLSINFPTQIIYSTKDKNIQKSSDKNRKKFSCLTFAI